MENTKRGSCTTALILCCERKLNSGARKGRSHSTAPYTKTILPSASRSSPIKTHLWVMIFISQPSSQSARDCEMPRVYCFRQIS